MTNQNERNTSSFPALATGYGILGAYDYAYFPVSSIPEFSLAGDKPFTIFTVVCFKNVQGGAILEQENSFRLGVMDGKLYMTAVDWCAVKFSEYKIGKFAPGQWCELALTYDGSLLTVYAGGEKKDTFRCNPGKGKTSSGELIIGKSLDAYFRTFRLFGKALPGENIRHLLSGEEITPEDSILWLDFDKTGRKDQSPNHIKLSTKAFGRIVMLHPVKQFRFSISRKYCNVEGMVTELLDESTPVNFTGCISSKPKGDSHTRLTGMVSLGTPTPILCELEGEIVTTWESTDIPQTDLQTNDPYYVITYKQNNKKYE